MIEFFAGMAVAYAIGGIVTASCFILVFWPEVDRRKVPVFLAEIALQAMLWPFVVVMTMRSK